MMQQTPKSLARTVECEPDRCSCGAGLRPTITVNVITDIDVPVMAESRILAARHDALLLGYTDLVRYIAYHLFRRRNYVDVDDLIDAGMVGLSENIHRHGHHTAGSLEADVSACIRAAMLDFVRKSDWSLRAGCGARRSIEEDANSMKSPRRDATP
jgi:DNA-directed RNA polymerase specialized sigma subunit